MYIIVNADDFGKSHEVNLGVVEGFKRGLLTRTTIMVNMPFADEAVRLAVDNGFFDKVGLHLNLTEGYSLTENIRSLSWVCENGKFNDKIRQYLRWHYIISNSSKLFIMEEIEAQMNKFKDYGFILSHIDSHHHVHNEFYIYQIVRFLSLKHGFKSIRILRNLMPLDNFKLKLKYIYKLILNYRIKSLFDCTDCFGSYDDFCIYMKNTQSKVEIMVHPILHKGELYDVVNRELILMNNYILRK